MVIDMHCPSCGQQMLQNRPGSYVVRCDECGWDLDDAMRKTDEKTLEPTHSPDNG